MFIQSFFFLVFGFGFFSQIVSRFRHPVDKQPKVLPFTESVEKIRQKVNELTGFEFNHCLIQLCKDDDFENDFVLNVVVM